MRRRRRAAVAAVEVGAVEWDARVPGSGADLYFLRARYYDPASILLERWRAGGRFIGRDPLEFAQRYAYAGNNPVAFTDPAGLCPCIPATAWLIAAGAAAGYSAIVCWDIGCGADSFEGSWGNFTGNSEAAWDWTTDQTGAAWEASSDWTTDRGGDLVDGAVGLWSWASGGDDGPPSVNQLNEQIRRGKAPTGVDRVDGPNTNIPGSQRHVHIDGVGALNVDGKWRHGGGRLTNRQRDWLEENGWILPD